MTDQEICDAYFNSEEQSIGDIMRIAQQSGKRPLQVCQVLRENGYDIPDQMDQLQEKKKQVAFTPEEDKTIQEMSKKGLPPSVIAKATDHNRRQVSDRLKVLRRREEKKGLDMLPVMTQLLDFVMVSLGASKVQGCGADNEGACSYVAFEIPSGSYQIRIEKK